MTTEELPQTPEGVVAGPEDEWGQAYSWTPLLDAAGISDPAIQLNHGTTIVIYNNTGGTLYLLEKWIDPKKEGDWSTGNGVNGEYPYGVPPKTIDKGASGRIQLTTGGTVGIHGKITYADTEKRTMRGSEFTFEFDNVPNYKNDYSLQAGLVSTQKSFELGFLDGNGKWFVTHDDKSWNSDTLGKGLMAIIGICVNGHQDTAVSWPAMGERPDKKAKACADYRKLAKKYQGNGKKIVRMWRDGRIGALAGAYLGMVWACTGWDE
ncbi:hypothetical protein ACH4FX_42175 [Streptomyces sp. NPDC018019]|uniref:hypothetical protein n=1 Tax=Streptomyces sp. NPDC018019 TaxID=3365030 RepID=UPI0037A1233A